MQRSIFFLKVTLSVVNFSIFENMDFVLSDIWFYISFMSPTSFIICSIQFSDGFPGLRLTGFSTSARDMWAGVWEGRRRRWPVQFNLFLLIVMFQGSTSVEVYNCSFEMVLGHVLFSMILSCLLWNALIFSSICLVIVHCINQGLIKSLLGGVDDFREGTQIWPKHR